MIFLCHVTWQDHVVKGYTTLWFGSPQVSHHPIKFNDHRHYSSGDITVLAYHVIW